MTAYGEATPGAISYGTGSGVSYGSGLEPEPAQVLEPASINDVYQAVLYQIQKSALGGIKSFKEGEDAATMLAPGDFATLLRSLSDPQVQDAIHAVNGTTPPCRDAFRPIF